MVLFRGERAMSRESAERKRCKVCGGRPRLSAVGVRGRRGFTGSTSCFATAGEEKA